MTNLIPIFIIYNILSCTEVMEVWEAMDQWEDTAAMGV
jgi:hypothetical protein